MKKRYYQRWIDCVKQFQSLSEKERNAWCSNCGCTGGCNVCTDLSTLDLSNPISYEEEKMIKLEEKAQEYSNKICSDRKVFDTSTRIREEIKKAYIEGSKN